MRTRKEKHSFAGVPRRVMESDSYRRLNAGAAKLLFEFAYQYRGNNNGDLTAAWSVLNQRGWNSKDTIRRARDELLDANLIIRTRTALRANPGGQCDLYAITWRPIDECKGKSLDVKPTITPPRKFSMENNEKPRPHNGHDSSLKKVRVRPRDDKGRFSSSSE